MSASHAGASDIASGGSAGGTGNVDDALAEELEEALAALERLEDDRDDGALQDEEFELLVSEATARAAEAIRAVQRQAEIGPHLQDQTETQRSFAPAEIETTGKGPKSRREWLLVFGVLSLVAALGIAVGSFATSRLPGQTISGSLQLSAQQKLSQQLVQGRVLVAQGRDTTALQLFSQILAEDPSQPEALAYQGWLMAQAGRARGNQVLIERGRSYISRSIQADPGYPDAHLFLGEVLFKDEHDLRDALIQMRFFLLDRPSQALLARSAPVVNKVFQAAHITAPLPQSPSSVPVGDSKQRQLSGQN